MSAIAPIGAIQGLSGGLNAVDFHGVSSVGGAGSVGGASAVDGTSGGQAPGGSFLDSLGRAFGELNGQLNSADATMANFASGGSADLHTVMLEMEEAAISLKVGVQVRDKLLQAYQDLMRTQL